MSFILTEEYGRVEGHTVGTCQCGGPIAQLRHEADRHVRPGVMTEWYPPVCSTPTCMIRKLSREADFLVDPWPWGTDTTIDVVYPGLETQFLGRCECGDMILRLRYHRDPGRGRTTAWFAPFCSTVECMIRALSDEAGYLRRTGQWTDPLRAT